MLLMFEYMLSPICSDAIDVWIHVGTDKLSYDWGNAITESSHAIADERLGVAD